MTEALPENGKSSVLGGCVSLLLFLAADFENLITIFPEVDDLLKVL